jgi:hypothetical protein
MGVVATTAPATRPEVMPAHRRAVIAVTTAATAAASALGMMTAAGRSRRCDGESGDPERTGDLVQGDRSGGSNEPKKKFGQLRLIDSAIDA